MAPTLTPANPLTLPSENTTKPRVSPTATLIAPHILPSNNVSEPRVCPTAAPIKPRKNIVPIHVPHSNKHLPPIDLPTITMEPPNKKLIPPKNYANVHVTKIMKQLTGNTNKYTKIPKRRRGVPARHKHYTRARTHGSLAHSVIQMNEKDYQHHIENHV